MKNNILKVVVYAALACIALLLLTSLVGFLAWMWAKIVGGFVLAGVLWLIQRVRHKETTDYFILWWGIGLSLLLISLDIFSLFLWKYGVIVFALAVAGVFIFGHKTNDNNPQP
ncbi:MAG: hypothetical protein WCJ45_04160 [bacterium]